MRLLATLLMLCLAPCYPVRGAEPQGRVVVAYVTSWSQGMPDPGVMTHINYAFGKVAPGHDDVVVDNPRRLRAIVDLKRQNPQLKVLLSIGGWGAGGFSEMASRPDTRQRFCQACARVADEYGLDGIDVDWEYPGSSAANISSSPQDREHFTLLMHGLRQALGEGRLLTLATAAMGGYYDFPSFVEVVDFVNMMTYDMASAPRHHAPLYTSSLFTGVSCLQAMLAHLEQGVPACKLVLGLPFYGRGTKELGGFVDYHRVASLEGFTPRWDREARVPYLVDGQGGVVLGYDDERSLKGKCRFARKRHLRGVMYWDYHGDDAQGTLSRAVWRAMR
ncbi:MAG: glycoside hydrolase family 18 protein [Bacteroidaceae bacterium]